MARILSLETSTDVCAAALHEHGRLINEKIITQPQAHASALAPMVLHIFEETGIDLKTLDAVAVSSGPGSYTGLRIGTSTAKGLCFSLDIPLIAIPTLDAIAFNANQKFPLCQQLCAMIDARRMEVYCQIFDNNMHPLSAVEARVIDEQSFLELLDQQKLLFGGNGVEKCRNVISHENAFFAPEILATASAVGALAELRFQKRQFEDLEHFTPFYLKEFVAKKAQALLD
jgi:tRNA threonylcarbamoyladenosine biosynthesis protein TsaB